ncbi:ABC transporter ATP-binding protein [Nocardiopsis coralliicola]
MTAATGAGSSAAPAAPGAPDGPLVRARDLSVRFRTRRGFARARTVRAVDGVGFDIAAGETLGLVGESGSGKSTTGRALLRLVPLAGGSVTVDGRELSGLGRGELRAVRRDMQMVFQDPYSSLDPSATVAASIAEPLRVHDGLTAAQARPRITELLETVGLRAAHADRYPYEFSGGQRQRVAIARALATRPRLVVCDEAVSALDVSTQNQVINLLEDLRSEFGLSYLFIAHDLAVVRHIAHRVAVMYLGRIVEEGSAERVYTRPAHPYTRALLSAIPVPDPRRRGTAARSALRGELPDPAAPPSGCTFRTRCPEAMDICARQVPVPVPVPGGGTAACHLLTAGPSPSGGAPDAGPAG